MFSLSVASPFPLHPHRRGGPVHVRVLLRELEADLVEQVLTESLDAVESYGAPGGCPTCHDGEMRERVAKAAQQA